MAAPVVTDRDHGYNELKRRWINHRDNRGSVVGIFGEGAAESHGGGVTNLLLAIIHEFGAPSAGIPARSWLRAFIDENGDEIRRVIRGLARQVLRGELGQDAALGQLGAWIAGKVQARIANKIPPPLAASTVAKRRAATKSRVNTGSRGGRFVYSKTGQKRWLRGEELQRVLDAEAGNTAGITPLIDSGQFRQSITHEVRDR